MSDYNVDDLEEGIAVYIPTALHQTLSKIAKRNKESDVDTFIIKSMRDTVRTKYPEDYTHPYKKPLKEAFDELTDMEKISLWLVSKEQDIPLERLWAQRQAKEIERLEKLAQSDEHKLKAYLKSKRN